MGLFVQTSDPASPGRTSREKTHFQAAGWKQNNQIMHHVRGERQQTPGEHIPARRAANVADGAVTCVIHACHRPDWGKQWRNKHCKRKHDTKLHWSMISVQLHLYYSKTPEKLVSERGRTEEPGWGPGSDKEGLFPTIHHPKLLKNGNR